MSLPPVPATGEPAQQAGLPHPQMESPAKGHTAQISRVETECDMEYVHTLGENATYTTSGCVHMYVNIQT